MYLGENSPLFATDSFKVQSLLMCTSIAAALEKCHPYRVYRGIQYTSPTPHHHPLLSLKYHFSLIATKYNNNNTNNEHI